MKERARDILDAEAGVEFIDTVIGAGFHDEADAFDAYVQKKKPNNRVFRILSRIYEGGSASDPTEAIFAEEGLTLIQEAIVGSSNLAAAYESNFGFFKSKLVEVARELVEREVETLAAEREKGALYGDSE